MKKLVVFDWGGLIENFSTLKESNINLLKKMGYKKEEINDTLLCEFRDHIKRAFTISSDEEMLDWYKELKTRINSSLSYNEFSSFFKKYYSTCKVYDKIVDLIYKTKEYADIALLSNLIVLDRDRLEREIDLDKFDYLFLSYELKMKKPTDEIYKYVEETTKRKPNDILLIDDTYNNILTAKKRGWNYINESGSNDEIIKKGILEFTNEL